MTMAIKSYMAFILLQCVLNFPMHEKLRHTVRHKNDDLEVDQKTSTINIQGKMPSAGPPFVFFIKRIIDGRPDIVGSNSRTNTDNRKSQKLKTNNFEHEKDESLVQMTDCNSEADDRRNIRSDRSESKKASLFEVEPNDSILANYVTDKINNMSVDIIDETEIQNSCINLPYSSRKIKDNLKSRTTRNTRRDQRKRRNIFKNNPFFVKKGKQDIDNVTEHGITKLTDMSITLCPLADFCHFNTTEVLQKEEASCCKPCHCDINCGQRLDCCFQFDDRYKEVETFEMECVAPVVSFLTESKLKTPDYYMIHSCLSDPANECKNKPAAEWGSFFPVYSYTADKIYFNSHCAECNNINDFIPWNVSASCVFLSGLTLMSSLLVELLNKAVCEIQFVPFDAGIMEKFSCHNYPINTCNTTGKWTEDDPLIREACESINAPVKSSSTLTDDVYANVFCKLCNGEEHKPYQVCEKYKYGPKSPSPASFAVMLDHQAFNTAIKSSQVTDSDQLKRYGTCGEFQVKHPYKDKCLAVLCPTGYVRTPLGCTLFATTWYSNGYKMFLDLTAITESLLPMSTVMALSEREIRDILENKGLPTDAFMIMAENFTGPDNVEYVHSFSIMVGSEEFPLDARHVMESAKAALTQDWILLLNDITYTYKATISRRIEPQFLGLTGAKLYRNLSFIYGFGAFESIFVLNKLYFCEQVNLLWEEWSINDIKTELKLSGFVNEEKVLYNLEFNTLHNENGDMDVQICVEDFSSRLGQRNKAIIIPTYEYILLISLVLWVCKFS